MDKDESVMELLWSMFSKINWLNGYVFRQELGQYKPSENHFISYVGNNEEANVTKLAEAFNMTRGAISKLSRKLIEKGLVDSFQKSNNKKEIYFSLTEKGYEVFQIHEKLHERFANRDKPVFESVSKSDIEAAYRFAEAYNIHLDNEIAKLGLTIESAGIDKM